MGFKIDGKNTVEVPALDSGFQKIECIYEKLPGWQISTEGIVDYEKLPKKARAYLDFVAKQAGAKVGMISTGPDRGHTILLDEFVSELKVAAQKP